MSRSCKKTPVTGMTSARSEKEDKRIANHRIRREPIGELFLDKRDYGGPWDFAKDGKQRLDVKRKPHLGKYLRK